MTCSTLGTLLCLFQIGKPNKFVTGMLYSFDRPNWHSLTSRLHLQDLRHQLQCNNTLIRRLLLFRPYQLLLYPLNNPLRHPHLPRLTSLVPVTTNLNSL